VLAGLHMLTRYDDAGWVEVQIREVAGIDSAVDAADSRHVGGNLHDPALEREHTVRALRRRAGLGLVVGDGHVHADVKSVRPGIQKRTANRVLAVERRDRPPPPGVGIRLDGQVERAGDGSRRSLGGEDGRSGDRQQPNSEDRATRRHHRSIVRLCPLHNGTSKNANTFLTSQVSVLTA
jgi:hypothetical protein